MTRMIKLKLYAGNRCSDSNSSKETDMMSDTQQLLSEAREKLAEKENMIHELEKDLVRANAKLDNWEDKLKTAVAEKSSELEKEYQNATKAAFMEGMSTANQQMTMYSSMLAKHQPL